MATAEQIKSLIRSHVGGQPEQFYTVALQVAAHEARKGHSALADDIRKIVDKARSEKGRVIPFISDLGHLVLITEPRERLSSLVHADETLERLERILREYRQKDKLAQHGLKHRRKILLSGPPGTGKTLTASVIAGELKLPLYTIQMDKLVTKYMGETSAKLRQVFDMMPERRGVYLFDEFDAIGGDRGRENDVGEMRRVLNAFLQLIERDESDSLIIAATNNPSLLDSALFRRFDDILHYALPQTHEIMALLRSRLGVFLQADSNLEAPAEIAGTLSHAEITKACDDAIKEAILADDDVVALPLLQQMLQERRDAYAWSVEP